MKRIARKLAYIAGAIQTINRWRKRWLCRSRKWWRKGRRNEEGKDEWEIKGMRNRRGRCRGRGGYYL